MSIISNAKEIADLIKKIGDIELYRKIVELESEIVELTREKRELEGKLESIKKHTEIISKLKRDKFLYFMEDDPEPYCPHCVEANNMAVHLYKTTIIEKGRRLWMCTNCKNNFPFWHE